MDRATWARLLEAATPAEVEKLLAPAIGLDSRLRLGTLRAEVANAGSTLVRFLPRGAGDLVAWYNRRFDIENLKTVLRSVHYGLDRSRALASLIPLRTPPGAGRWRWEELVEAGSIPAVIDRIHDSPFARPLEHAMERYQKEQRLFYLEIAVDLFYFQKLVRLIESLRGGAADDARRFLGRWIAVQNLLWAYRYRIYGRMSLEEILNYTLHRAFAASLDTVRRVALGSPLAVEAGQLGFTISPGLSEVEGLTEVETLAERERFRYATAATGRPMFQLRGVLAYLWLLEAEVRDLAVLVEGKRTGLPGEEIGRRLVRTA
jgi:V/A-type H+-transporting ATPase subunit C